MAHKNICNDFIIVSKEHDRTNPKAQKIQPWAGPSCCFLGDTGLLQKHTKIGKRETVAMETGPHHVCVLEVVVWNVWAWRGGGWDWKISAPHISHPQDPTERVFNTRPRVTGKHASSVQEKIAFSYHLI